MTKAVRVAWFGLWGKKLEIAVVVAAAASCPGSEAAYVGETLQSEVTQGRYTGAEVAVVPG